MVFAVFRSFFAFVFFFNDTATTEIYTLSLHDALPIWSAGGPSLASTEKKLPPLPKIADQGEAEIHAASHAHRASHVPHRQSEDLAGLTGRTQGSLLAPPPPRMSMGMDNAGVAKKMSRNLDLPLDESQSRKSSKSLDQPIDGDSKRQKHSFGVIAAKDRKLLH